MSVSFDADEFRRITDELVLFFRNCGLNVNERSIAIQVMDNVERMHALHMEIVKTEPETPWTYRGQTTLALKPSGLAGILLKWPEKMQEAAE